MAIIPGKWEVFTLDTGSVIVRSLDGDAAYKVAKVWGDGDGDVISTASLIAAAPELLAELKACKRLLSEIVDGREHVARAWLAAGKVIDKAEGRV